ncbi:short-chain collagen C4-like [Mytilus californianus]|uniref:short-chain collagen C4-like n=1 Tax=Mytilus californianus TaxID=6549 RepID=UPI002247B6AB|nr:short-chain collagen C4-like [Mytilus californianus]
MKEIKNVAVTYTVWGRKQCPNNSTQLVYSGFAGGSYYSHSGAAVDYLCLPPDPSYRKTTYSGQYGRLYGAEYDSTFIANGDGNDVPCAVCRTSGASTILMIPGKDTCYGGWNIEYYGYLMAHNYNFAAATSYVCLHINPEFVTGGGHNYEGKLFHPVIGICGALQCPPYVNNYPVTCAVCSK